MAEVRPFHGIRFNQKQVSDPASVICPPYDVISLREQHAYHEKSPYNIIRLEFGLDRPGDWAGNNKYTRARDDWRLWRDKGVLESDAVSFYVHKHRFPHRGEIRERTGLTACVRLEPWDRKIVLPHEHTGSKPKADRLELMRACRANISPIFALYQDSGGALSRILTGAQESPPTAQASLENGEAHSVWSVAGGTPLLSIEEFFAGQKIFVADGHHRYETALAYQNEMTEAGLAMPGAGYVMMTLVEFSDPGLLILPVHRLVRGLPPGEMAGLKSKLHSLFDVKTLPVRASDPAQKATMISDALRRRRNIGMAIGVWGQEEDNLLILRLRQGTDYDAMMPPGHSYYYYRLEISRLQHLVMDELETANRHLEVVYTPDEVEVVNRVGAGEYQIGFFIKALETRDIKSIALAGDKTPRKSSYFHPKLPTGLVMRSVEESL
ncbi:MAG: DUF1015 domain-containing protein [Chloroflexi bacterium]|nr:DUF1015 domain-containing protein [Chloroflexota bacterium]